MKTIEDLPDGKAFLARLRNKYRSFFAADVPLIIARAPGRLDVMGGIADYSGATVCEMPIAEAAFVALQPREDDTIRVRTTADVATNEVTISLRDLPIEYEAARQQLTSDEATMWAAYVLGAFVVLACEGGMSLAAGANVLLDSAVPLGKGVSSSAAIEVATLRALTAAAGLDVSSHELAVLAQTVENRVVGAPCGLMDQLTSVFGEANHLLKIKCQPEGEITTLAIPDEVHFVGIDSGVRHAVTGASYGDVRVAAFMGYRMIADALDLKFEIRDLRTVRVDDPQYRGFLCNVPIEEFQERFIGRLPERMRGDEFLARFGGITDTVTDIEPSRSYAVRAATTHPVEEQARVLQFIASLAQPMTEENLMSLGALMYQAHASYSRCGLGSDATDALVEAVRQAGPARGVFGAKITGGGSGGTVAVLAKGELGLATASEIAAQHARAFDINPYVFRGSSPGAAHVEPFLLENL
ncbi:MAG TPA: galactokinase family protein [Blastocatellia bacterium]|nr:galactokinase family protein [Blastocatellia bacterium]